MRRIVSFLAGVLLVVLSLGSDSPGEYDGAAESDELEGSWRMVMVEYCGRDQPVPVKGAWTFRRGRSTPPLPDREGTYKADPSRKPAHLDETELCGQWKGKTWKCIYQVEGDTLRIAVTSKGDERPKNFDDKKDLFICTYKRVK
jgi:uncharacterized protein (TIGR03067 family)